MTALTVKKTMNISKEKFVELIKLLGLDDSLVYGDISELGINVWNSQTIAMSIVCPSPFQEVFMEFNYSDDRKMFLSYRGELREFPKKKILDLAASLSEGKFTVKDLIFSFGKRKRLKVFYDEKTILNVILR